MAATASFRGPLSPFSFSFPPLYSSFVSAESPLAGKELLHISDEVGGKEKEKEGSDLGLTRQPGSCSVLYPAIGTRLLASSRCGGGLEEKEKKTETKGKD